MPLLIDGTNVILAWGPKGSLEILTALCAELVERGEDFTCIFDASTRYRLQISDRDSYLGLLNDSRCFSEATGGIRADEFLLTLASADRDYKIISNDRFRDYREEYPWLESSEDTRLIKGNVFNNTLVVPSLGIVRQLAHAERGNFSKRAIGYKPQPIARALNREIGICFDCVHYLSHFSCS